jgi:hypothetical protein
MHCWAHDSGCVAAKLCCGVGFMYVLGWCMGMQGGGLTAYVVVCLREFFRLGSVLCLSDTWGVQVLPC